MTYTIKAMSLGEILDQSIALVRDHFKTFLLISCFFIVPLELIQQYSIWALIPLPRAANPAMSADVMARYLIIAGAISLVFLLFFGLFAWPVTHAAIIRAVASEYLGRPTTPTENVKEALKKYWPLLGTSMLSGVLILLGTLALVIPGIYLMFRYWFCVHAVMLENISGSPALERSGALMRGNMGTAFVLGLLLSLIGAMGGVMAQLIPIQPLAIPVHVLIQTIVSVLTTAAGGVLYFSSRCKLENFDLMILSAAVAEEQPPPIPSQV